MTLLGQRMRQRLARYLPNHVVSLLNPQVLGVASERILASGMRAYMMYPTLGQNTSEISFSLFPWNTLAPFPSVQMLLISQVLLYKASKRPSPCPTKWTLGLLWVIA